MNVIPFPLREVLERDVAGDLFKEVMDGLADVSAWLVSYRSMAADLDRDDRFEASRAAMLLSGMYLDMAAIVLLGRGYAGREISGDVCIAKCADLGPLYERAFQSRAGAPEPLPEIARRIAAGNELLNRVARARQRILRAAQGE